MKRLLFLVLALWAAETHAQDYNVASIPDSLVQHADVVKRFEELHVTIKGIDKAVVRHRYAITILNENGDDAASYSNAYTKLISLGDISGKLYDAGGKLLKTVRRKDIADRSANDDESLLTDARYKSFTFYHKIYPYTVEFEDEQVYDGIYFLPIWQPVEDEKYAVQQSRLIVETPSDYGLRYKQQNYALQPVIADNSKVKTYTWQLANLKGIEAEPYQPDWQEITPTVHIAPTQFVIGGYKGDMSTWSGFGRFVADLNRNRDELPESVKQEVQALVKGLSSNDEKIDALYRYMQQRTRYISIQLGIGSWQPFEAKYVAEKKYGDCKALSNYMVSLLKEAGIPAYYTLITSGAGRKGLREDFPAPYFNHAVVCVPGAKDTTWLECTSQTVSTGYMGSSTGNRKALMITEKGGEVVYSPVYKAADNSQLRVVTATVDETGTLTADINTHFTGSQQELSHSLLHHATQAERDKYLNRELNLPTYKVEKINYTETRGKIPAMDEILRITSSGYASITGKRLFITPNLFNRVSRLPADKPRQYDIEFRSAYVDVDSILITIPDGYTLEALPKPADITNRFGRYSINCTVTGNRIILVRKHQQDAGKFPAGDYPELVKYFEELYKADRARVVLVKKES
ncbi:DUF3857 domain-containing transglutaminase family protein [Sediminibacterium ginsengisoli]|uniref:Transglutaminase-like superfamily protein n=1 Tax=Sediminibacterium ginsengisoli TaxID=413434 RepID=A0A1T4QHI6_9BACT|nr:DUF3857 domain-containing transglutaminase family protein [Sediminibacterium ginsengisoli]SKA03253.1 Transglutaminase-like superfamily protein [Sediminibacterium ginsengisoli]